MQLVTLSVRHQQPIVPGAARNAALAALCDKLNAVLPADVRIRSVRDAPAKAHAITGCGAKTYTYYVIDGNAGADSDCSRCACVLEPKLDVAAMRRAATALEGEHDFASLSSAPAFQDTVRTLSRIEVRRMCHVHFPILGCLCQGSAEHRNRSFSSAGDDDACVLVASEHCCWCTASAHSAAASRAGQIIGGGAPVEVCEYVAMPAGDAAVGTEAPCGDRYIGGSIIELRFIAPGFLRHQVRRMAALLIAVGSGREDQAAVALALRPRAALGPFDANAIQTGATGQWTANAANEGSRRPNTALELFPFPRSRVPPAPAAGLWLDTVEYGNLLSEISSPVAQADEMEAGGAAAPVFGDVPAPGCSTEREGLHDRMGRSACES